MTGGTYRVLILGDVHFGESYTAPARILAERGYTAGLRHLRTFAEAADTVVANLETPLVDPSEHASPMEGVRRFLHWGHPRHTIAALREVGVDAVNLANNHMLDRDQSGLEATLDSLHENGMSYFGAGRTISDAEEPYVIALPASVGGGEIAFSGSFTVERQKEKYNFYATEDLPGCAPLSDERLETMPDLGGPPDRFSVAFPHWGPNYDWRTLRQRRLAMALLRRGHNLVLGHGAHSLQEVERVLRRWVVYGIGNGVFHSGGRFGRYEKENAILPMSFWTMLEVRADGEGRRDMELRLYPVYSDNSVTDYQPYPVELSDFRRVVATLEARLSQPRKFANDKRSIGRDDLGWFIALSLGEWPFGRRPKLLPSMQTGGASVRPRKGESATDGPR